MRGRWNDSRFRLRFTPRESGLLQAWVNGAPAVDYHGVNAYPETTAMGLYRDLMAQPMTIYIDEYARRELTRAEMATPAAPPR